MFQPVLLAQKVDEKRLNFKLELRLGGFVVLPIGDAIPYAQHFSPIGVLAIDVNEHDSLAL